MISKITLTVPEAVAQALADCEVGEEKGVQFNVTAVSHTEISGDVSEVEGYPSTEEEEPSTAATATGSEAPAKKMPKAIVMIGAK